MSFELQHGNIDMVKEILLLHQSALESPMYLSTSDIGHLTNAISNQPQTQQLHLPVRMPKDNFSTEYTISDRGINAMVSAYTAVVS